jgi:DNA primase catalytic subunit
MKKHKLQAAVELGRLGGLKGGKARAGKLSAKQRSEIASYAAASRWANPSLRAQIKEGWEAYKSGDYRSISEFMTELEQEPEEDEQSNNNQESSNRTKRKGR